MQPEFLHTTISANGKCAHVPAAARTLAERDLLENIELIIDATAMIGSINPQTLLGCSEEFLEKSRVYTLTYFEPREDGTCLVRYQRCRQIS